MYFLLLFYYIFYPPPTSLTIPVLNMLLNELLCVSKVPPGVKHVDLDLSTLPPTTAMAVVIYNRWYVSFHARQSKESGKIHPSCIIYICMHVSVSISIK